MLLFLPSTCTALPSEDALFLRLNGPAGRKYDLFSAFFQPWAAIRSPTLESQFRGAGSRFQTHKGGAFQDLSTGRLRNPSPVKIRQTLVWVSDFRILIECAMKNESKNRKKALLTGFSMASSGWVTCFPTR